MGFISDIKAIRDVARLKNGGVVKLSISQITGLIINLSDAQRNLTDEEFKSVYALYKKMRQLNIKKELNFISYVDEAVEIIEKFDKIANYEKFSGRNDSEFSLKLDEIRRSGYETRKSKVKETLDKLFYEEDENYADLIIEKSFGQLNKEDAHETIRVIQYYQSLSKSDALKEFEKFASKLITKYGLNASFKISFILGLLSSNNIITKQESNELSLKYTNLFVKSFEDND